MALQVLMEIKYASKSFLRYFITLLQGIRQLESDKRVQDKEHFIKPISYCQNCHVHSFARVMYYCCCLKQATLQTECWEDEIYLTSYYSPVLDSSPLIVLYSLKINVFFASLS